MMSLTDWLAARAPNVPDAFREHVTPVEPDAEPASPEHRVAALTAEARAALGRARDRDPADRAGAFDLLAADAWATWAADAALETEDPVAALTELARRLSDPAR
jgi:hypothetical protein